MIVFIVLVVPMLVVSVTWLLLRAKPMGRIGAGLLIGPLPIVVVAAAIAWGEYSPHDPNPAVAFGMVSLMNVVASAVAIDLLEWSNAGA